MRLPVQLQRAMAAEAEAAREARAKVIAAEGEQKASHALKEAASVIQESPSALQVPLFVLIFWCYDVAYLQHLKVANFKVSLKKLLQLRYLQTLTSISAEKNSTIIFPLPIDFITHFVQARMQ